MYLHGGKTDNYSFMDHLLKFLLQLRLDINHLYIYLYAKWNGMMITLRMVPITCYNVCTWTSTCGCQTCERYFNYSQVHYVFSWKVAVIFGFDAFLDTFLYLMLKTGCFHFFVKLEMAAIFVFKMANISTSKIYIKMS